MLRRRIRRAIQLLRGRARGHSGALLQGGIRLTGAGSVVLARRSVIREDAHIYVGKGARLELSERAVIGIRNKINVETELTIGRGTEISWDVQIMDTDFHEIVYEDGRVGTKSRAINIGEHVLIGACAMILKGVTIGDNAIVAAGSVVTRDVRAGTIVAGNPASVIREGVQSWN